MNCMDKNLMLYITDTKNWNVVKKKKKKHIKMKQRHDRKQEMKDMRSFPCHKSFGILTFYMQTDMTGENKQHTRKFTNRCYRNSFLYSVTSFSTDFKRLAYTHSKTQDSSFNWLSLYYAICEYIEAQIATLSELWASLVNKTGLKTLQVSFYIPCCQREQKERCSVRRSWKHFLHLLLSKHPELAHDTA